MITKYCLTCGKETPVTESNEGNFHTIIIRNPDLSLGYLFDVEICNGPFTNCPPPDMPEMELIEPAYYEMQISDIYSRQLLADFIEG